MDAEIKFDKRNYRKHSGRNKELIKQFGLDKPVFAHLCKEGLFSGIK